MFPSLNAPTKDLRVMGGVVEEERSEGAPWIFKPKDDSSLDRRPKLSIPYLSIPP